jgi:hypothetical protein
MNDLVSFFFNSLNCRFFREPGKAAAEDLIEKCLQIYSLIICQFINIELKMIFF